MRVEPRGAPRRRDAGDFRCGCGSLLARISNGRLELKCRRCKRIVAVDVGPFEKSGGAFEVSVHGD